MIKLHFETVTPLFIGSGETLERDFHYKIDGVNFRKYNENRLVADLAKRGVVDFQIEQSAENLKNRIREGDYKDDHFFEYTVSLAKSFDSYVKGHETTGKDAVQEFINSNGKFYIPGSSIKGALCNVLNFPKLGIADSIEQRFVIHDCVELKYDDFLVFHYDRPPYVNLLAMKPGVKFSTVIPKPGVMKKQSLIDQTSSYFKVQISKAITELEKFQTKNNRDDLPILELFEQLEVAHRKNLIINLGFGGGSWFKVQKGTVPTFSKKNSEDKEIPTTTYHYQIFDELYHIGWCKMEVEEC